MSEQTARETVWTPANKVTLLRILLIPLFVVAIISPWPDWIPQWSDAVWWKPWVAALVFILIAMTDSIDGYLARSRNEVTNLGKFMDPLADKILVAAALLALVELGALPSWVALVILAREFIVSGIRMVAATQDVVIAASWYGKAKTVFQIIAIVLFIVKDSQLVVGMGAAAFNALYVFSWVVMGIALILTIVSMIDYFSGAAELLGFKKSGERNAAQGDRAYAMDREFTAASVIADAVRVGRTVATAESCTGGLVGAALTSVPGSSEVYLGGVVSYANEVKQGMLDVDGGDLDSYGAVSEQVACAMAEGARKRLGVDVAVSTTGIAGPGGAVVGKPVGTVWIGISTRSETKAELHVFDGEREQVRAQAVDAALASLSKALAS